MVDLLAAVLISGVASFFWTELFDALINHGFVGRTTLNLVLAPPIALGSMYALNYWDTQLIAAVPAATFIALALNKVFNKPQIVRSR